MREVPLPSRFRPTEGSTFQACVATILELALEDVPQPPPGEDASGWRISRWLGGLGLGLVPVLDPPSFAWPGPWVGVMRSPAGEVRCVVMYGNPSGVAWDPSGAVGSDWTLERGFAIAAADIALARPALPEAPSETGTIEALFVSPDAGAPSSSPEAVAAIPDVGLEGDRHTVGKGTFPSGLPGSALTLIEAEVCESFDPPLTGDDHRRNVVTRGIDLNRLVGHEFMLGDVPCRGMRLCEPCTVIDRYAGRALLRPLVHRGGLRADILADGVLHVGDRVQATR